MFYYFGRKGRIASKYPAPKYPVVVEPFAGSAAYSLFWKPEQALLFDIDPQVVELWNRLTCMTEDDIRQSPALVVGQHTDDPWHLSALASRGTGLMYRTRISAWGARSFEWSRNVAIKNLETARRFDYRLGCYEDAPDIEATWFIDPPYQKVGKGYRHGADGIDFERLAEWVRSRRGQVIVCEQEGADWLPFQPFVTHTSTNNRPTKEVWWTNDLLDGDR